MIRTPEQIDALIAADAAKYDDGYPAQAGRWRGEYIALHLEYVKLRADYQELLYSMAQKARQS